MDEPNPAYLKAYFTAELPRSGAPKTFGIVTAYDPGSAPAPAEANREADARLEARLSSEKRPHFRVTGRSLDGSHQEPGYGIESDSPEEIRTLSRAFRQQSFFWIEDGVIYLINTGGERRHLVGKWADRLL
jgi:hypothetical protein